MDKRAIALSNAHKPVVHYTPELGDYIEIGRSATIFGVQDHPNLGAMDTVYTSRVIDIREDGEFETENTIYMPV